MNRRDWLRLSTLAGVSWLTPLAGRLAIAAEKDPRGERAQSVIFLWLSGGPSQLETFDPHPGTKIAGGTKATNTAVAGVKLVAGLEQVAEQMPYISLIRSLVSKEGDHQRGAQLAKTGYRPTPTAVFPTIGAICCHELPLGKTEIPRHISILPDARPGWGGYLGAEYDAFKTGDPASQVPDLSARVSEDRFAQRLRDLEFVDRAFVRSRARQADAAVDRKTLAAARAMMTSEQLSAFDVKEEPAELLARYGDTPFGRGCLAARRLVEKGVRCVEVTLRGWDSHFDNHATHKQLVKILDPALATLIQDLRERGMLERTVVMCGGEFGRTPKINPLAGRDHWTTGFSMAVAGGGLAAGRVIGETDPEGGGQPTDPHSFADVHATVLTALGIDIKTEYISKIGRPLKLSDGTPIKQLLAEA